jgi:hypothetical protein
MRAITGLAVAAHLLIVACSTPDPFSQTEIGKKRIELYEKKSLDDFILNPEKDTSFEALLGDAAFEMTRGMTADEAIEVFETDGAVCAASTCEWTYTVREALLPCGVGLLSMCIREPGPRRTFQQDYEVTILTEKVSLRADLTTRWSINALQQEN